jgi:alpha-tubulin suppressor-like RCC1 family protein
MTEVLKKVAANATNSGAIDNAGQLFVWGSTKYGLCPILDSNGNQVSKNNEAASVSIEKPTLLHLKREPDKDKIKGMDEERILDAFNLLSSMKTM